MNVEIYYFSGTGNSLYIAKELQNRIPETELIPIVRLLNQEKIETRAQTIGIVFPLQGPTFPNAVKKFLQKADLKSADYIFAIATRAGTSCRILIEMNKLLKKKGKSLNSHFVLTMFNNDPKLKSDNEKQSFHILTEEEIIKKNIELKPKLDNIQKIVANKETSHEKDTEYTFKYSFLLELLVLFAIKTQESKSIKNYFYSDSKCTSCGICEKVCISKKIEMIENKPRWNEKTLCHMCYACLNFCPAESVQINSKWYMKSFTATQGRYSHPFAKVEDIAGQK